MHHRVRHQAGHRQLQLGRRPRTRLPTRPAPRAMDLPRTPARGAKEAATPSSSASRSTRASSSRISPERSSVKASTFSTMAPRCRLEWISASTSSRSSSAGLQELSHPHHRAQRRAHLVAHQRQELVLGEPLGARERRGRGRVGLDRQLVRARDDPRQPLQQAASGPHRARAVARSPPRRRCRWRSRPTGSPAGPRRSAHAAAAWRRAGPAHRGSASASGITSGARVTKVWAQSEKSFGTSAMSVPRWATKRELSLSISVTSATGVPSASRTISRDLLEERVSVAAVAAHDPRGPRAGALVGGQGEGSQAGHGGAPPRSGPARSGPEPLRSGERPRGRAGRRPWRQAPAARLSPRAARD